MLYINLEEIAFRAKRFCNWGVNYQHKRALGSLARHNPRPKDAPQKLRIHTPPMPSHPSRPRTRAGEPGGAPATSYADGRDELNLADFPISVLQRQQPKEIDGRKLDQVVYESTTYDPVGHRRVPQRVTLTTSSRVGLPTPADENVILALLYTAKRQNDFTAPRVHFSPHQLFGVMRWTANSRSYTRLSQVLLRLKSLTILYENAWWDPAGHKYQEEFATGIIAEYRLLKTKLRRKSSEYPPSYVHWTPQFFKSLASGNLKKLDLDRLFALNLPTSQRMYRFLDKRFYLTPTFEIDFRDFACGHLGVSPTPNVAELKRRVAPALAELEAIGFLKPASPKERYVKLTKGVWRIRFHRANSPLARISYNPALPGASAPPGFASSRTSPGPEHHTARAIVAAFYNRWSPGTPVEPTDTELRQAQELVATHGAAHALELVDSVVALMRSNFPNAKRFGASLVYFREASEQARVRAMQSARQADHELARHRDRLGKAQRQAEDEAFLATWTPVWEGLAESDREAIRGSVLPEHPYLRQPLMRQSRLALRVYLEALAARRECGEQSE